MIIALTVGVLLSVVSFYISFLIYIIPSSFFEGYDFGSIVSLIRNVDFFVPADKLFLLINSIVFWYFARFGWAAFEWLYKKIPGVD